MNATFMCRITRRRRGRATRKLLGSIFLALAALGGLAGCHTPGPGHVYAWSPAAPGTVQDVDAQQNGPTTGISGRVAAGERVVGLAYDFNTDFLCLRLEPGARIRIFKRGENRIMREWPLPAELAAPDLLAAPATGFDLAVRPSDRHLFALRPAKPEVWEFTLEGQFVRVIALAPLPPAALGGLTFDHVRDRLVALVIPIAREILPGSTGETPGPRLPAVAGGMGVSPMSGKDPMIRAIGPSSQPAQLIEIEPDGRWTPLAPLADEAVPGSLGCNGDAGEYYVPLATGGIGVFDRRGILVRRLPLTGNAAALDAGPRSFVRVF
jgi:hypothetical protein